MGKVFLGCQLEKKTVLLEYSTSAEAMESYHEIKSVIPTADIVIFASESIDVLRRTNSELEPFHKVESIDIFIREVSQES